MKKWIKKLGALVIVVCVFLSELSIYGITDVKAASTSITEEQLYYQCPVYLNNATANQREQVTQNVISKSLSKISKTDEWTASYILGLQQGTSILLNEYVLSNLGITQSQYDKYVDDAIDILMQKYLSQNTRATEQASSVSTLYNKYLKKAYDISKEVDRASFTADLKNANNSLTDAQIDDIVNKMIDANSLDKLMKYTGDGIELWYLIANFVEMQEIEVEVVDDLISVCASNKSTRNSDLHNGLLRYREKITKNIGEYMVEYWLKDKAISKLCSTIKNVGVYSFANASSVTKLGVSLAIDVIAWMYGENHPTAKQIVEAMVLQNFVVLSGNAVTSGVYDLRLADSQGTNKKVLKRQYMNAHDLYYACLQCALNAAKKCTQDKEMQNICTKYENAYRNTWTYTEYIKLCLKEAQADIDAGNLTITSTSVSGGKEQKNENYYESIQARFTEIQRRFPVESTWTDDWGGAIQCFGFARMVFHYLYGCEMPYRYDSTRYQYTTDDNVVLKGQLQGSATQEQMKELMSKGQLGDIIQANGSTYGQHTMVFMAVTDSGVQVYDCNSSLHSGEGACRIHQWVVTWDKLAKWYNTGISLYHAKNYENIYGDGTGTFYDDTVNFVVDENGVLVKYNGWQSFVEIPESVNDITITAIGDKAFANNSTMVSVSFPDTIKKIGASSFSNCTALAGIQIPDTVESVGSSAFSGCKNMEFAGLPNNGKFVTIGNNAFENCSALTEIIIPDSVTQIEGYAFKNCTALKDIKLSSNLISVGSGTFMGCSELETITIPKSMSKDEGERWYSNGPFANCGKLKEIKFEEGITAIPSALFQDCEGIEELEIPGTVTRIRSNTFVGCKNLAQIIIPDSITQIGNSAFGNCSSLTEVTIPDNVTNIGNSVFRNCISLKSINLPDTITEIPYDMFSGCENLDTINLPASLKKIGNQAFYNCRALTSVTVPSKVTSVGTNAFKNCSVLTKVTIPDATTSLGSYVFDGCDELTEVTLGKGLSTIPQNAFSNCGKLERITIPYYVQKIESNAFVNDTSLKKVTIPRSTTSIADGVFSYPGRMTIYGVAGTYAETYANDHNIAFVNEEVKATAVSLDKEELTMNKWDTAKLNLTVAPANCTDAIIWKSSNTEVVTVDDKGNLRAEAGGTANIKVTVGEKSAVCKVTVPQPVESIYLNRYSLDLGAFDTYQLTAEIYPEDAMNKKILWTSSDEGVVKVDDTGKLTPISKGTATIRATAEDGSGVYDECEVEVTESVKRVTSISQLESAHNYKNNEAKYYIYNQPGATRLYVTFDQRTYLEEDYDYIYIYDGNGKKIGTYTGDELAGEVIEVPGSEVRIKLETDSSGEYWGFKVVDISTTKPDACATGHRLRMVGTVAATCVSEGHRAYYICDVCKKVFTDADGKKETVVSDMKTAKNPNNHTGKPVTKNVKESTYDSEGYTGDVYCQSCGIKIASGKSIAKKVVSKGAKAITGNVTYKVTSVKSNNRTVEVSSVKGSKSSVTIPKSVKIAKKTYKVTTIGKNAFKGNKKVTKITIPAQITSIKGYAFKDCKKLKQITIQSTKLTSKTLDKKAFSGIGKKVVIKVPKSKLSSYKKLFKTKGLPSAIKIKK